MSYEDTARQALDAEYLSRMLDEYLDVFFSLNPRLVKPSEDDIKKIRQKVITQLQQKYPNAGIILKEE